MHRVMAAADFCDLYPRFLETTETVPSRSRLNARWRAIIGWNTEIFAGRRVVDLGCHDGRWSFAALKAGAAHVTGIEARAHLLRKAEQNFVYYGVAAGSYRLVAGDAIEALRGLDAGSVDVVLCLGFFYHTMDHMRLLLEARRLGAEHVILDTFVAPAPEAVVALAFDPIDDTRMAIDYGATGAGKALVGTPSTPGLLAMLDYAGYQAEFFDWQDNAVDDWTGLPDYAAHQRITVRARRLEATPRVSPTSSARDLYIDLLIRSVVDGIYGDPMPGPWRAGNKFDRGERRPGTLGPTTAHTMVGVDRLINVRDLAQAALDAAVPGDFIETGVWRGGCCILMRGILAAYGARGRKVYVADSFQGVPPPKPDLYPADVGDTLYRHAELAVSLDIVKANFDRYGLLDGQVVFVEGFFGDTLPSLQCGPLALLRLDGDLYESTDLALRYLYPKLSPGGFVIIDDYGVAPPCRQAVHDYRTQHGIDAPINTVDRSGVWWRKPVL
jgi:O-methyltransferase